MALLDKFSSLTENLRSLESRTLHTSPQIWAANPIWIVLCTAVFIPLAVTAALILGNNNSLMMELNDTDFLVMHESYWHRVCGSSESSEAFDACVIESGETLSSSNVAPYLDIATRNNISLRELSQLLSSTWARSTSAALIAAAIVALTLTTWLERARSTRNYVFRQYSGARIFLIYFAFFYHRISSF